MRASRNYLAKTFSDSANNYHVYQRLKDNLQDQRSSFGQFYKQVTAASKASGFIHNPAPPRQTQVPRRLQHGDSEQLCFRAAEHVHRVQCVEAIDACLVSLNERFDQEAFLVLSKIETVY